MNTPCRNPMILTASVLLLWSDAEAASPPGADQRLFTVAVEGLGQPTILIPGG